MVISRVLETAQLSALSRFFSSSIVRELARKGSSPLLMRLARESLLLNQVSLRIRVSKLFDRAFDILKRKAYRDEYIYKAALTHKVLFGTHSLQTASMLTEFRVGQCKADLVILNGTATAYEIKSERDSLSRLARQIDAYKSVFAQVYVIAGENHVASVLECVPDDIGVLKLSNRYQISTLREAKKCPERTSAVAVLDAIRLHEGREVLKFMGIEPPNVPNTELYGALRKQFLKLDPCQLQVAMVAVLRKTRALTPLAALVAELPDSLHTVALSVPLRRCDHERLVHAINTPLKQALNWI